MAAAEGGYFEVIPGERGEEGFVLAVDLGKYDVLEVHCNKIN